ncbi:cytochrome P450 2J4-like isoform X3 [Mercenaria mercenaria]|uniref:cytochrome P450 2J4-like isoform X3 n=1 Tax=Mercenaria mercenaria TaxID=6596 RepID=UPI00234E743E|nr:cytochrome P450 2J4-like isoform X3 [Mercenaria mercenaria]
MYVQETLVATASVLAGFYGVLSLFRYLRRRRKQQSPGPVGYPFFGILSQIGNFNVIHKTLTAIGKRYGRFFQFKLVGKNVVVLRSASIVQTAFDDANLVDRKETFFQKYVFNGKGFAFANYKNYVPELRNVFHTAMYWQQSARVKHDEALLKETNSAVRQFLGEMSHNFSPDPVIKDLMAKLFTIELIGETLPVDDPDSKLLWELIDHLYTLLEPSIDAPLRVLPFLRFLPGKYRNIFRDTIKARDGVARRYFDTQKSTYKEGRVRGLVDVCLKIQQEEMQTKGESWLTDDYIKGLMYDTVAAGMSEMMKSIRMLILLMCHYQNVQSRVHTEIDDVIGTTSIPCSSHRNKMPYTEAVLLEMLRYVSQTPLAIPHKSNKDVVLDGYLIEKDSGIFPNIWGIHHDEIVWGDPWVFRPERFLTENDQLLPADHKLRRTLIPFSVGKRRCPGEDFAMSRLFLLFTSMLQRIEFSPPAEEELPSADPRLYTNKYPLLLPVFTCRALPREAI